MIDMEKQKLEQIYNNYMNQYNQIEAELNRIEDEESKVEEQITICKNAIVNIEIIDSNLNSAKYNISNALNYMKIGYVGNGLLASDTMSVSNYLNTLPKIIKEYVANKEKISVKKRELEKKLTELKNNRVQCENRLNIVSDKIFYIGRQLSNLW